MGDDFAGAPASRLMSSDFSGVRALGAALLKHAFRECQLSEGTAVAAAAWLRGPDAAEILECLGLNADATEAAIERVRSGPEVRAGNW